MSLNLNLKKIVHFLLFFALIILLTILVFNINWFALTPMQYELDTFTYQSMLDSGMYESLISNDLNILGKLITEPAWSFILVWLNHFLSSETIIFFIIPFLILISYSVYLYKNSNLLYILFLMHPIALMFYLNQLRLAFVFCIFFLLCGFLKNKKTLYFFSFFLFLIHTSFLIFLVVFLFIEFLLSINKSNIYKIGVTLLGAIFIAFLTGPALSIILEILGDRRADAYENGVWQTSLLTSSYCLIFIFIFIFNFHFNKRKIISFEQMCAIFFLAMVVVSPIFVGGYPFRFLSAIFPIMLISFYQLDRIYNILAVLILIFIGFYIGFFQLNWVSLVV